MTSTPSRSARRRAAALGVRGLALLAALALVVGFGPAPAEAASRSTWQRMAMCESSGDWHIRSGNHFFGGLQFWQPTWKDYGGQAYAKRADLATKAEQIRVAERVLRAQGWKAWPACSLELGLREPEKGEPGWKKPAAKKHHHEAKRHHAKKHHAKKRHHKAKRHHAKKHHAKKHHAKKRHAKKHHATKHRHHARTGRRYVVRQGDTLQSIAQRKHVRGGWEAIYRVNRHRLSSPGFLPLGTRLRLPRR